MAPAEPAWLRRIDRLIGATCGVAAVLVLPLSLLLFAQWPLRDVVHGYSREANDLAQCLFALHVCIAITAATRARGHLAADLFAQRFAATSRARLHRIASLCVLAPWATFMLYAWTPSLLQSLAQWERFPETYDPGYFLVKLAVALMALLVLLQALVDGLRSADR